MQAASSLVVHGASGRMGQALVKLLRERDDLRLAAALVSEASPRLGQPADAARGVPMTAHLDAATTADVLVDFSSAGAFDGALALAVERRLAFVSGTTGLSAAQEAALEAAAASIPVLWSANFSIGIAVLGRLVTQAAQALADWDCEIFEMHHAAKRDAPSGTALALGRLAAAARGQALDAVACLSRPGPSDSARTLGTIGFASLRAADIVGEHTVLLATQGERIELTHRAGDRDIFARGALFAARAIARAAPGRYHLDALLLG
ncbi:4-hydroxy-tetrahydrodipicolinate reductase [Dokdonella sp.]|uniref:4-hydroxy-tetrahydrodipicolinate reductase n=1 Tax=Dokdonella sp. TaxID=2291710 RepID=UPI0031C02887|nr:4-hydroxy-tetrahydrodipicolinate reductase [Dokdonella sp.]